MKRLLVVALVVVLAGCGGSKSSTSSDKSSTVKVAGSKLGRILVDRKGRTLYLFAADKTGKSTCNGSCAATWAPVTASAPSAGSGVDAGALGTTTRADGTQQVTYHGHPLYTYAGDGSSPGSTKGEALKTFGGAWYVVDGAGKSVKPASSGSEMGNTRGYGY